MFGTDRKINVEIRLSGPEIEQIKSAMLRINSELRPEMPSQVRNAVKKTYIVVLQLTEQNTHSLSDEKSILWQILESLLHLTDYIQASPQTEAIVVLAIEVKHLASLLKDLINGAYSQELKFIGQEAKFVEHLESVIAHTSRIIDSSRSMAA